MRAARAVALTYVWPHHGTGAASAIIEGAAEAYRERTATSWCRQPEDVSLSRPLATAVFNLGGAWIEGDSGGTRRRMGEQQQCGRTPTLGRPLSP